MDYQSIINDISDEVSSLLRAGKVADYIPALAGVNPEQFAMTLTLFDGTQYSVGQADTLFSIQSISKVFSFTLALKLYRKELYKRMGVEPSGNPFNSLVQLEKEQGKPRNPFINAGAINVADALISHYGDEERAFREVLEFIQDVSDDKTIESNKVVASSEMEHGYRNLALANFMKSFNNLDNSPQKAVETYSKYCSVEMNTKMLSRAMLYLANDGIDPITGRVYITESQSKRINAVMLTCGHYDASGDFAFNVGLPGKSGVGGGIVAVVPKLMGIAVFSPGLNLQGNSLVGTKALELFTTKTKLSIF
ncbi:MAG: glutaminase [Epsilonproteobacteria bacterium]|nr:glutaminase [Campylobacterota bacterium]OIO14637.1 MAG: glutaminase [Helicobacteraceae bacterium CG1_02_36_14]PIP09594.1 MAG: glutaminase [Sulfurimonas sp. CG23_combo_of_CG06-09_8_20_14_all_36_33]PIS25323.1 MAG: glutaminase [Sulfurimonas sp. CG08_land_8_20_14_0_20_36_33]PIU33581.1 MAG: glutaminase [Sulfurimonas sp. CG07_land_8_20_14_0_80_36_56]PIV04050.1 MAG: glutaminase [Sulfurimonas sp. CG03_land_8_20_14_0_80_36_25]PIV35576.1 MAG: glutaminase [Sulfurimonas sp. CG02_land_8_20_14_3_00_36_6